MKKNTNYSKEDEIRLKKIIEALDSDIKRLKVRRKNYKKQLILSDVVKSSYCLDENIKGSDYKCLIQCESCKKRMK